MTNNLDNLLQSLNNAQAAIPTEGADTSGQPWTPQLVITLSLALLVFGLIICGLTTYLLTRNRQATDVIRGFSLPLIIVSAVVLVVAGYSNQQISSVIGLLGTIAGYLLGSRDRQSEPPSGATPVGAPPALTGTPSIQKQD
jgi:hypothetical protein